MGKIITGYKIMGQEAVTYAKNNKAQIASVLGIVGTLVSNIMSTKAGAKSARMIDAKENELGRALNIKEKVALCWKNHIGAAVVTAGSMTSSAYSNNQHVKNFNMAATAYAGVKKLYDSTKKATKEVLGEKKAAELQDKLNRKEVEERPDIKQKLENLPANPDPATMQRYLEPHMGELVFATKDKIELILNCMRMEMKQMKPRTPGKCSWKYGVPIRRFYELGEFELPKEKWMSKCMEDGWNKGKEPDGSDDDDISAYYSPMMVNDDRESVIVINWYQEPSDMKYGDYVKDVHAT